MEGSARAPPGYVFRCPGTAVALAVRESARQPVTVLGELVHNETVLDDLRGRGVRFCGDVGDVETPRVMITAHGASDRPARGSCAAAACASSTPPAPLVRSWHTLAVPPARARRPAIPVIVGRRDHVEVRGLTGDLDAFDVVLDRGRRPPSVTEAPDSASLPRRHSPAERVQRLASADPAAVSRAPRCMLVDTVCAPHEEAVRNAALELARNAATSSSSSAARASNNTRELADACRAHCSAGRVHRVQAADGPARSTGSTEPTCVGLTAGTSTPDTVIDLVEARLRGDRWQPAGSVGGRAMIPDDPFYQPRPARSLPRAMAIAPMLDPAGARAIDRCVALLVNPFYVKTRTSCRGRRRPTRCRRWLASPST